MDRLGINSGFLLAQIVNFGAMAIILALMVWRPLVNALEARREKINKGLEDARAAEQARANAERDAQKYIEQRRAEANKFADEGRQRGEEQARAVIEEANRDAEAIRTRARSEAESERNALLGEVRTQVAQLAIAAAERVIGQSLDQNKSVQLISDFFTKAPDAKGLGDTVDVTSALPLTDEEKKLIQTQTGAKNITYKVDPAILGGIVLRAGEKVVDGSVRSNLSSLAAQIR